MELKPFADVNGDKIQVIRHGGTIIEIVDVEGAEITPLSSRAISNRSDLFHWKSSLQSGKVSDAFDNQLYINDLSITEKETEFIKSVLKSQYLHDFNIGESIKIFTDRYFDVEKILTSLISKEMLTTGNCNVNEGDTWYAFTEKLNFSIKIH